MVTPLIQDLKKKTILIELSDYYVITYILPLFQQNDYEAYYYPDTVAVFAATIRTQQFRQLNLLN